MGFVGGGVELGQDDAIGGDYQITPVDADGFRRSAARCGAYQSAHVPGVGRDAARRAKRARLGSGAPAMLMNLFDSHDTARARMLREDAEALKLLLLMQACAPGPPMIYQGTEVGQIGALGSTAAGDRTTARRFLARRDAWTRMTCCRTPREVGRFAERSLRAPTRGSAVVRDV